MSLDWNGFGEGGSDLELTPDHKFATTHCWHVWIEHFSHKGTENNNPSSRYYSIVLILSGQVWEFSDLDLICPPVNSALSSATPYRECLFDGVFHILGCLEESLWAAGYRTFLEPGQPLEHRAHIAGETKEDFKVNVLLPNIHLDRTRIWGGIREIGRPSINTTYLPLPYFVYLFLSIICSLYSLRTAREKGKQKKVGERREREGEVSSLMFVAPAALRILCLHVLAALRLPVGLMLCSCPATKP